MSQLFTPITLGKLSLPNRIVIAPMCQYSADDGKATEWHTMHLGHLALSGAGLLIVEATSVAPEGRITPNDLGLWDDATEQALAEVIQAVRKHATLPLGIQLGHAGRKASCAVPWAGGGQLNRTDGGWQTLSASDIPFTQHDASPAAMSLEQIEQLKAQFVTAAKRADRLGFELIELHGAHGYLLHQFLSPLSNQRNDQYGGSLQNRMRLLLEIYNEVRAVFPAQKALGVRISASDWVEGSWDEQQSVALAKALKELGCDYIHVSSGGLSPLQKIPVGPNYQVPFAETIKRESGLPTIAVGLITEPEQAEAIVATGQADMVALARGILYNPRWPWHAAAKLGEKVSAPPQYWRSEPHVLKGLFKND
ncbi:oxidoreductase [Serratia liquefaciens]|uniref:NADH:flavin oxidoreductase/NADH oxidase n=1 Tax=Serratia liquefaciens TaxID=614 RepID=UPI000D50BF8D|nr:NADH:flavin oxidoreductase/NADH oxidase [Serratia liquefaciens]PVD44817.1 oxidoreductase [Serratia liquefaciens]QHT50551.1 NADH:flavin oxidoreductase/NADH oxidase [Serratia liquefaciens]